MTVPTARTHDQEVGARLRELRLRYVLKQEELAKALGFLTSAQRNLHASISDYSNPF